MPFHKLSHALAIGSFLVGCPFSAFRASASTPPRISYQVAFDHRRSQLVDITMTIRDWPEKTLDVHLPVWRPGRYEILDTAGSIRTVLATDGAGQPLPIEKTQKSSWRITSNGTQTINIIYQAYANSLGNRTRHVDDTHAFLSGTSVFMYCHELRSVPVEVSLALPESWLVACGLDQLSPSVPPNCTFTAPDYDTLIECPIEAGLHTVRAFTVADVPHEFAIWGRADVVPQSLTDDAAKIIKVEHDLFGSFPHQRYVFLTHITPGIGGGTEQLNSSIIQTRPTAFDTPKDYRNFLSLISHEYFHTWNIKQFRPQGLKPYDYDRENYTTLLWIAEGTTSYYDELLCARAGVWKPDEYLEALATLIENELSRPGAAVQSLESSSFDAWIKFNHATPDSINSTVSFYNKGALVNFLLDAEIRCRTENAKSLDDLMRTLYQRFPLSAPAAYSPADILSILREHTGDDFEPFFSSYIRGTVPITPDAVSCALANFGLESQRDAGSASNATASPTPAERCYLGIDLKDVDGAAAVTAVRSDSPAATAGVLADDQIVAFDGFRFKAGDLDARLKKHKPGETISLSLFRREQLLTVSVQLSGKPAGTLKIVRTKNPTRMQRGVYESWMGQPWPGN